MHYVTTDDNTRLFYKDWGTGRPVILMSGWPLSSDSWDDQAMDIAAAGFRVIAYDRRGFGRSSQPWSGYDYDSLSDDLAAVIKHTEARDATLVGFSMGGGEVARYMSRHQGASVMQAALIASVVPYMMKTEDNPEGTEPAVFEEMTEGMKKDRANFFASFARDFYGDGMLTHPVSEEVLDWTRGMALQASLRSTLECAKSFATTDFRKDLPSFKVPTLIIHGTADKTVPIDASARAAAQAIAGSTLIEYEDAAHGLFATHKERLSADLIAFLRSI